MTGALDGSDLAAASLGSPACLALRHCDGRSHVCRRLQLLRAWDLFDWLRSAMVSLRADPSESSFFARDTTAAAWSWEHSLRTKQEYVSDGLL